MISFLMVLPIILLLLGIAIAVAQLFALYRHASLPVQERKYNCLKNGVAEIISVSKKYGNRIRGSVRLSQGKLKSIEELKEKENQITFP